MARRPSEVEAMEAELESDKSGPVCIVNRYRHSKRQRVMEKQLAESPTCSPAGGENEQHDQRRSFAAGSHESQESPTHTSVGGKRRHEPEDQPTSLSTGGHRFLASPTRAGAGGDGRDTSKESTETSPPDWALPMLQIQRSALSVICV